MPASGFPGTKNTSLPGSAVGPVFPSPHRGFIHKHSLAHLAHAPDFREFHYLVTVWWQKFAREQGEKDLTYFTGSPGAVLKTDLGWAGQSRQSREKVMAAKWAGGDEGGWTAAGRGGCGERTHAGSLRIGWTEFADRLDVGVREREEAW